MLWCRFQQCFGTFNMLLVQGSSETWLFSHLSDYVLRVRNIGRTKSMGLICFLKIFKKYLVKALWCRFQMSLGTFTILLLERLCETGLFRHLSNNIFGVRNFLNTKAMRVIIFSKWSKFQLDFKNTAKNWEKIFCFRDSFIWIAIVKLSLLRTGYFLWPANKLTSCPKIWHVNKRDSFQLNCLGSDKWIW